MAATTIPAFDYLYEIKEADICNRALARIGSDRIRDTIETTKQCNACRAVYEFTRDELVRMFEWNFATRHAATREDEDYDYAVDDGRYAFIADDRFALTGVTGDTTTTLTLPGGTTIVLGDEYIGRRVSGTNIRENSTITAVDDTTHTLTIDRATTGAISNVYCYIPILKILSINYSYESMWETVGGGAMKRILTEEVSSVDDSGNNLLEIEYLHQILDPDEFDPTFTDALVLRIASKIAMIMTKDRMIVQKIESEFSAVMQNARNVASQERQVDEHGDWWTDRRVGGGPTTRIS